MTGSPLLKKVRLLMVRERELNNLRLEHQLLLEWVRFVQKLSGELADSMTVEALRTRLLAGVRQWSGYEFAAMVHRDEVSCSGLSHAEDAKALFAEVVERAREGRPEDDEGRSVLWEGAGGHGVRWMLAGWCRTPAEHADDFGLLVGRTSRTAPFFTGPWDGECERFGLLMREVEQVVAGVHHRDETLLENQRLQKRVSAATRDLQEALAASQESERQAREASLAKSRFLATMSHELRTPLNAILGLSELLEDEPECDVHPTLHSDAAKIRGAGKHLLDIVTELLDMARIESGRLDLRPRRIGLVELLEPVRSSAESLARDGSNTLVWEEPAEVELEADPQRVRQIVINLLGNACKFTRDGRVRLYTWAAPDRVWIAVEDTGIGIGPDDLERVFQPFEQADQGARRRYEGTGLGLAISRKFAQRMGGDIEVESALGRGSTFRLWLPTSRPGGAAAPAPHAQSD